MADLPMSQLEWDFPPASVWEYRYWQKVQGFYFKYPRDIIFEGKLYRLYRMFALNEAEAREELRHMVWSGNRKYKINYSTMRPIGLREAGGSDVKVEDFVLEEIKRPEKMPEWFPNRGGGARIADASGSLFGRLL